MVTTAMPAIDPGAIPQAGFATPNLSADGKPGFTAVLHQTLADSEVQSTPGYKADAAKDESKAVKTGEHEALDRLLAATPVCVPYVPVVASAADSLQVAEPEAHPQRPLTEAAASNEGHPADKIALEVEEAMSAALPKLVTATAPHDAAQAVLPTEAVTPKTPTGDLPAATCSTSEESEPSQSPQDPGTEPAPGQTMPANHLATEVAAAAPVKEIAALPADVREKTTVIPAELGRVYSRPTAETESKAGATIASIEPVRMSDGSAPATELTTSAPESPPEKLPTRMRKEAAENKPGVAQAENRRTVALHEDPRPGVHAADLGKACGTEISPGTDTLDREVTPSPPSRMSIDPAPAVDRQNAATDTIDVARPAAADSPPTSTSPQDGLPPERKEEVSRSNQSPPGSDALLSTGVVHARGAVAVHSTDPQLTVVAPPIHVPASSAAHAKSPSSSPSASSHQTSDPVLAALDHDPGRAALPAGVQVARLVEKLGQAEMHIGLRTLTFGSVEVHTTVREANVGVSIGSDKGDLRSVLAPEIPSLEASFRQHALRLDGLRFLEASAGLNSGLSAGPDPNGRFFQPPPRLSWEAREPSADRGESARSHSTELVTRTGLNVHA